MSRLIHIALILFLLSSCNNQKKIDDYTSNETVIVTIDVESTPEVKKIVVESESNNQLYKDSVVGHEIDGNSHTFAYPQIGEGAYSILICMNNNDTISSTYYAEGGYRPKFRLKNKKFESIQSF